MQEKFGITWWGNQWLNSLKYIDYANRIPRGTRYARNGSVFNLKIKEGTISARVKGNFLKFLVKNKNNQTSHNLQRAN